MDGHLRADVLEFRLAELDEGKVRPVADLIEDLLGDDNAARLGEGLQAGGHIDRLAIDVASLSIHSAQMNADASEQPMVCMPVAVALVQGVLNLDGAVDRLKRAGKLHMKAVVAGLDLDAVMSGECRAQQAVVLVHQLQGQSLVAAVRTEKPTMPVNTIAAKWRRDGEPSVIVLLFSVVTT